MFRTRADPRVPARPRSSPRRWRALGGLPLRRGPRNSPLQDRRLAAVLGFAPKPLHGDSLPRRASFPPERKHALVLSVIFSLARHDGPSQIRAPASRALLPARLRIVLVLPTASPSHTRHRALLSSLAARRTRSTGVASEERSSASQSPATTPATQRPQRLTSDDAPSASDGPKRRRCTSPMRTGDTAEAVPSRGRRHDALDDQGTMDPLAPGTALSTPPTSTTRHDGQAASGPGRPPTHPSSHTDAAETRRPAPHSRLRAQLLPVPPRHPES